MHPNALLEWLTVNDAAQLLAHPRTDEALIGQWAERLNEAIKTRKLPGYNRRVPVPMAVLEDAKPRKTYDEPHIHRDDLRRWCGWHGIASPFPPAPEAPAQGIASRKAQRLAAAERYFAALDDVELFGRKKAAHIAALQKLPMFSDLRTTYSWDHFWSPDAVAILRKVKAERRSAKRD